MLSYFPVATPPSSDLSWFNSILMFYNVPAKDVFPGFSNLILCCHFFSVSCNKQLYPACYKPSLPSYYIYQVWNTWITQMNNFLFIAESSNG